MKFILGLIVTLGTVGAVAGESERVVTCQAKVALNRVYDVKVDRESHLVSIKTDNGYVHEAVSSYSYSPRTNSSFYYVPVSFAQGILVELEEGGAKRIALCLKDTECYLCR